MKTGLSGEERLASALPRRKSETGEARPSMGEIGLNQFAPYLINSVASRWNANIAEEVKAHDLTTVKMRALAILSISSLVTINELSVYAVTEQSTMSRTVDALEEQGLARRQQRADDMRVREVAITEKGRAVFEKFWPTLYDRYVQLFDGVDENEYRAFIATLHKLRRNLRANET
jgi:MarR family transcriptional regulator, transcriptional regulator for hemolysin